MMIVMEIVERSSVRLLKINDMILIFRSLEGSLNNYLKANDVRVYHLIQMCYDIAKGMAYLEENNVIHR